MEKVIGKAQCLTKVLLDRSSQPLVAGVVRIGNENKIVMARLLNEEVIQVVCGKELPHELERNPAFSCWTMASSEEANGVIDGVIPTYRQSSLGNVPMLMG